MSDAGVAAGTLTAMQQIAAALGVALTGLAYVHGLRIETASKADYADAYLRLLPLFLGSMAAAMFGATRLARVMKK